MILAPPGPPVREVGEWQDLFIPGATLSAADRLLCRRLAEAGKARLEVDELRDGVRVRATSWVGVVRLGSVELHVVPKLAGEHIGLVRLIDWVAGLDVIEQLGADQDVDLGGAHLLDWVALLLVRQAERLVRQGLRTAYVEHEEALPVLRGRLLFDRQMRRSHGRLDRLECRYDERTGDIFDNQLVLAAVQRCAARAAHVGVRRRAGRVRTRLSEVCDARHIALPRRPTQYDRLNAHYRRAHELSWLVLEGTQGLDDLYESGDTPSFAFLLNMNTLFEEFVESVLEASLRERGVQLSFQKPSGSVVRRADTGSPYQRLIPDTLARVGVPSVTVPIDAKYKRYSERKVDPGDIAQMFIYASGLGTAPEHERPHGIIIYPSESREFERLPLVIRDPHDTALSALDVLGIPIGAAIDEATAAVEARPILDALADVVLSAASTPY